MTTKETYTKIFLNQLGKDTDSSNIKEYLPLWWQNTRTKDNGGLRLTDDGYRIIKQLEITTYEIPYPRDASITPQVIIFLDKFIDCPYFITKKSIIVTNDKKAVELSLFSGNLKKYGLAKTLSKAKKDSESC